MKIKIGDSQFEVSEAVAISIEAERTQNNRKIKKLKDSNADLTTELEEQSKALHKKTKKLEVIQSKGLRDSVLAKILEVDDSFKTDKKNPYKIMKEYSKSDSDDEAFIQSHFDSVIAAQVEEFNSKSLKRKKNKSKDSLKISKKYYGGN